MVRSYGLFSHHLSASPTLEKVLTEGQKRQEKVGRLRRIMALEKGFKERSGLIGSSKDEELLRQHELERLEYYVLLTINELGLIQAELSLLTMPDMDTTTTTTTPARPNNLRRVTQPFTLLKSNREKVLEGVFKPGHNLPTMTIDEYLELERARGGIIESSHDASKQEDGQDADRLADDEGWLRRQRAMDDYKDEHRRGSGNTYNRG